MKSIGTLAAIALIFLSVANTNATSSRNAAQNYQLADGRYPLVVTNRDLPSPAKSGVDTFCMLSHVGSPAGDDLEDPGLPGVPPNTYRGDFQDDYGLPHWDDWYCVDYTQRTESEWHIDSYNCQNLDPGTPGNHAWWCGENYPSCGGGDPGGGYGNDYEEYFDYWATVVDDQASTSIHLTAMLNYDNEPGYDYLYLQRVHPSGGLSTLATYNGQDSGLLVDLSIPFDPIDYVPHPDTGLPSCHLRWMFTSDGAWSDQDCLWPTAGASQLDLITVSGDNGVVTTTETCEGPAGTEFWRTTFPVAVGAFCYVWPLLEEIDECCHNDTPQVAFIDDGLVVPGTGGTFCMTWCYAAGGYVVNYDGGLAGSDSHLRNEIWSPVLEWPDAIPGPSPYDGAFLEFSVFRHFGLGPIWGGMFYIWHVRSSSGPDPEDIEMASWQDREFLYYGGPDCIRTHAELSDLMTPGRTYVQVALGIYELGWIWGWCGQDASPAPYFDDVRFCAYEFMGPAIAGREIDMAQDNFPAGGSLDCNQPCALNVRFDMARDISLSEETFNLPGDSIVFDVVPVRTGTTLTGRPEICYKLDPNPQFDGCRTSGLPLRGCVAGDSARHNGVGVVQPDRYEFDLPDSGFFYPGDLIHYYIRATDSDGMISTLPEDTSGFSFFPGDADYIMLQYPTSFVVRALPTIHDLQTCEQPVVLWWNDFANRGLENEWMHNWGCLGFQEGLDFDIYYTNGPSSGVGNGLGGRATASQLMGYELLAYSSGDLDRFTITEVNYYDDAGDDIGVLESWFDTGGKCMFLTGDDLVDDLTNRSDATRAWEDKYLQVRFVDTGHDQLLGQWNPTVLRSPDTHLNPIFYTATQWTVWSYCNPILRHVDLVLAEGTPGLVAEFLDANCGSGTLPYAAAVYNIEPGAIPDGQVVYLPYDLGWLIQHSPCGTVPVGGDMCPPRADVLRDVIHGCGIITNPPVVEVSKVERFAVRSFPNPFNPVTRVEYMMPQRGKLKISVYNVRGELVRTLLDEVINAGPGFVIWDGTDAGGSVVASGVYFCRSVGAGRELIQKMAIVK